MSEVLASPPRLAVSDVPKRSRGHRHDAGDFSVTLRYFDGCPNWRTAEARLRHVLDAAGREEVPIVLERVQTLADAERLGFTGSPTVLIDGVDPFHRADAPVGLTCRLYPTPDGLAGSPTVEQMTAALS